MHYPAFDKKQPGTQGLDGDDEGKVCEWGTAKAKSQVSDPSSDTPDIEQ